MAGHFRDRLSHNGRWHLLPTAWIRLSPSLTLTQGQYAFFISSLLATLFFHSLSGYPLLDDNEGLYAEIAREMLRTGHYIIPQLNGLPYIEKPPLLYWLTAAAFKLFGVNETSARLVPALAAALTCLGVWWYVKRLNQPVAALLSAMIAGTCLGFLVLGRVLLFDMLLTAFLTLSLSGFYCWWRTHNRVHLRLAFVAIALGVLTKGLVALVLPAFIVIIHLFREHDLRALRALFDPIGLALFCIIAVPWHVAAQLADADFARYYFYGEHVLRFLGQRQPHDYYSGPIWYYLPLLFVMLLPWSLLAPALLIKPAQHDSDGQALERFARIWFAVMLIFFSLSSAKATYYLITGIPPLAIILGLRLQAWVTHQSAVSLKYPMMATGLYALVPYITDIEITRAYGLFHTPIALVAIASMLALTACASLLSWHGHRSAAIIFIALLALPLNLSMIQLIKRVEPWVSSAPVAQFIRDSSLANATIVNYRDFEAFSSLPFYLRRSVKIVESHSGDLAYAEHRKMRPDIFLSMPRLMDMLQNQIVIVVLRNNHLGEFNHNAGIRLYLCRWKSIGAISLMTNANTICEKHHEVLRVSQRS